MRRDSRLLSREFTADMSIINAHFRLLISMISLLAIANGFFRAAFDFCYQVGLRHAD